MPRAELHKAILYSCLAMLAFAGNSVICRLALWDTAIDPASFTVVRLLSGALVLLLLFRLRSEDSSLQQHGSWISALWLIGYAICFSFAYVGLSAGTGALILFGFVQATMIVVALVAGDRPHIGEYLGWLLALAGMVWLLLPGVEAPPAKSAALMAVAGIAWGAYSIRGRNEANALAANASNFQKSIIFVVILAIASYKNIEITSNGLLLAVISGALTSGLGYVVWYAALNYLSTMQAALVQLSVPAIAALGGALLIAEPISVRLQISGAMILGGICLALLLKPHQTKRA